MGRLKLLLATAALLLAYVIWLSTAPGTAGPERFSAEADSAEQPLPQAHELEPQNVVRQKPPLAGSSSKPLPPERPDSTAAQRPLPSSPPSLPPEKQTLLVDLLADNEASFAESVSQRAQQGQLLSEDEFKALRGTHEGRVKTLLGAAEYESYQQHASTRPDRIIVQEATAHLGRPLSRDNTQKLLAVLAQERQQMLQSATPSKDAHLEALAQMADRVKRRAAEFLPSDDEQLALQEVLNRISQAPGNGASLGSGTQ